MTNLRLVAERLRQGETVSFRPHGHSMVPYIRDGELVTVRPAADGEAFRPRMIVLAKVHGTFYLHLVRAVSPKENRVLIGSAHHVNGWTGRDNVAGVRVKDKRYSYLSSH